jgi:hypothetical protein
MGPMGKEDRDDISNYTEFPRKVRNWLGRYGVFEEECNTYGIVYERTKDLLLLGYRSGTYYTGRYFGDNPKHPRYITGDAGKSNRLITFEPETNLVDFGVLVEDYISAIVVGRMYPAVPLFRAHIGVDALKSLYKRFRATVLWLDPDKYADALKLTNRYRSIGFKMGDPIRSETDPKECSQTQIKNFVEGSMRG